MRMVRIFMFASAKGGVGKSTLALSTARVLVRDPARQVLVVDADFTGTSLADGLPLCAPQLAVGADGLLQLASPPSSRTLDAQESQTLRDERADAGLAGARSVPFLNDLLLYQPGESGDECQVMGAAWRWPSVERVFILPSSSAYHDVAVAQGWLRLERGPWQRRLQRILELAVEENPALTDIVIDLPPGLFGFFDSTLGVLKGLERSTRGDGEQGVRFRGQPILVGSPDQNDLTVVLESFVRVFAMVPSTIPLINRCDLSSEELRVWIRRRFEARFGPSSFERRVKRVGVHAPTLGKIFRAGAFEMDIGLVRELNAALELGVSV